MSIKVDPKAVQAYIKKMEEEAKEKQERKSKSDPANSQLLKVAEPGKYLFRALPYVHNENPEGNPFVLRSYCYGIPIRGCYTFYSPSANDGKEDPVVDFVWEQMKKYGKNGSSPDLEKVKDWGAFLPKTYLFMAGIVRGREEEGPKLLKIGTRKEKSSDKHNSLWEFFGSEPDWMDPDKGFDIELEYEKNPMYGIILKQGKLTLARKSSKIGTKEEYEKYLTMVPNIDKIYSPKTTQDSLELLEQWLQKLGETMTSSTPEDKGEDMDVSGEESETASASLQDKLKSIGL